MTKKQYLVIVRAGDASLHPEWLAGRRDWDLIVSYYGDDPDRYRVRDVQRFDHKGSKWQGLYRILTSRDIDWRSYSYGWLPDDDLRTTAENINEIFTKSESLNAQLSQPALDWESHYSHLITMQHQSFLHRWTNFVEVMAPCFRTDFLERAVPTFNENVSGWGLDYLWPVLLGPDKFLSALVLDSNPVTHTRPIGSAGHGTGKTGIDSRQEGAALLNKYGIRSTIKITASGLTTSNLRPDIFHTRELLIGHLFTGLQEKFGNHASLLEYLMIHARVLVNRGQSR